MSQTCLISDCRRMAVAHVDGTCHFLRSKTPVCFEHSRELRKEAPGIKIEAIDSRSDVAIGSILSALYDIERRVGGGP